MRSSTLLFIGLMLAPVTVANHESGCTMAEADPSTYIVITDALGRTFYVEERGNPFGLPLPLSGFLFGPDADGDGIPEPLRGQGTWVYEEANGIWGLQRGGTGLVGTCFPPMEPCIHINDDPINDNTCGHGPDAIVAGLQTSPVPPIGGLPRVQVDAPGPSFLVVSLVQTNSVVLGCAGTVQVTVAGVSVPVVGVSLSASGCAVSPCQTYTSLGVPCTPNPIGCCLTLFAAVPSGASDLLCVRTSAVRVDVNDDGFWDVVVPAATVTGPPC